MPTGGVDATWESISAWIRGAACLGMGSKLIAKELVAANDFDGIQKKVEQCILWIRKARGAPLFLGVEHVDVLKPEDKRDLTRLAAKLFEARIREITGVPKINGNVGAAE